MSRESISRRSFLESATAAGIALWTTPAPAAPSELSVTGDIRVGVIGLRGRGQGHLMEFGNCVAALCDVDRQVLEQTAVEVSASLGRKLPTFVDYRRLLESDEIDAVSIATPNHTHALIAIAAAQAGKDVYVEKPVSHNVWEGRQLAAAAGRYNRIIQCGTQSRSNPGIAAAVEWVRAGHLGKVLYAVGTCYKPRQSIGKLSAPLKIPSSIDYDLWCGPAEKRELYRSQFHYDWHWDFNTGNGDMGNQGVHEMDVARWFLGEDALPPRVISVGGRFGYDDAGDTPNTQVAYFDYPAAPLVFETRGLPRSKAAQARWGRSMDSYRGVRLGVLVQCEHGHIAVSSGTETHAYDREGNLIKRWARGGKHFANWLEAVAARDPSLLNAEVHEGHLSSALCQIAQISHRLGTEMTASAAAEQFIGNDLLSQSLERMAGHLRANQVPIDREGAPLCVGPWIAPDPEGVEVIGNPAATALLSREYRKPYQIPRIV